GQRRAAGLPVRDARRRGRGPAGAGRGRGRTGDQAADEDRGVRRARRRPGVDPLLPLRGARLRLVLALPGAGGAARGGPGGGHGEGERVGLSRAVLDGLRRQSGSGWGRGSVKSPARRRRAASVRTSTLVSSTSRPSCANTSVLRTAVAASTRCRPSSVSTRTEARLSCGW